MCIWYSALGEQGSLVRAFPVRVVHRFKRHEPIAWATDYNENMINGTFKVITLCAPRSCYSLTLTGSRMMSTQRLERKLSFKEALLFYAMMRQGLIARGLPVKDFQGMLRTNLPVALYNKWKWNRIKTASLNVIFIHFVSQLKTEKSSEFFLNM